MGVASVDSLAGDGRAAHGSDSPDSPDSPGGQDGPDGLVARVARVLGSFDAGHPSLGLSELARRAGIPLTSTFRLARSLTAAGFLEREPGGKYHVGLRLWEVASFAPRGLGLREVALPFMEDLFQVTQHNVQLAVRDGTESVYLERIAGRRAVPVLTRVGGRFPLHPTGVGRVLLAWAPAEVVAEVLGGRLERFTPLTTTDPDALRRVLDEVRSRGYAVNDRQVTLDSLSVAAPVRQPDGAVIAALSVVVPAGSAGPEALAPMVQAAARGISRSMTGRI